MNRSLIGLVLALTLPAAVAAQDASVVSPVHFLDYPSQTEWLPGTPGTAAGAVGGFINPAAWSSLEGAVQEAAFWWNDRSVRHDALDNWGMAASGLLGFGVNSQVFEVGGRTFRVTDWQLGLSGGSRSNRLGLAYRWAGGDAGELGWAEALVAGWLWRPGPLLSAGAAGTFATGSSSRQGVFDVGVRPLGDDRLTVYGDLTLNEKDRWDDGLWGAGVTVRPLRGLTLGLTARDLPATDDLRWIARVGVTGDALGLDWLGGLTDDELDRNSFLVRFNPASHRLEGLPAVARGGADFYAPVNLENRYLTYQKYRHFDSRRVAWLDLMAYLDAAERDPQCRGLVLNLTDLSGHPSLIWELRQRLEAIQAQGKEVVALVGRIDLVGYYLASVADHLIMEPQGDLVLQGVAAGRTYFAAMLEKLGLGYQELRYLKYKSAAEVGSRMDMSEGDREQRDRLVEVIYGEARRGICEARGLTPAEFDSLVDDTVGLSASRALARGLVDALGSRKDAERWITDTRHGSLRAPYRGYFPGQLPEQQWGRPDRIAVVFAVGECAMDTGIKGRETSRYLHELVTDPAVKAVVLRVDSPGGDPLPCEMVAAAVQRLREAGKPVIVSQGDVAASGGYWLSKDGAEVLTTPLSITGSIGVIAAWIWAKEFDEKVGLAYDGVQRGEHADLLSTLRLPGLDLRIPYRELSEKELGLAKDYILEAYDGFIAKVAASRGLDEDAVREIAQGRVWMGGDAIERDLCDRFGGLGDAIARARAAAGIAPRREVDLVEYPERGLVDLSALFGRGALPFSFPFGWFDRSDPWSRLADLSAERPGENAGPDGEALDYGRWYLQIVGGDMGRPRAVLPPECLPAGWGALD
ncbi:MAG TPA: S49 family peptidase [Candidatus Krumholzibacteria bacterium]|nr:S49 family peptidase [Candidatus Krumholzibacteria bacterium]HPD70477.1 S49 family peptidase [Candidatus Krumholzibacteria bacterium]HRY39823.1 S49 family peptidase [Candidatus Krumholzibacteria bacterium]